MKKITITESEKREILGLHKSKINEELSTFEMLQKIQTAVGANPDGVIGPDTSKKIVSKLKELGTAKDYTCITNLQNGMFVIITDTGNTKTEKVVEINQRIDGSNEYQIGDLVFQKNGTYEDLTKISTDTSKRNIFTYSCDIDKIVTSNHGTIEKGELPKPETKVEVKPEVKVEPKLDTTQRPIDTSQKTDTEKLKKMETQSNQTITDKFGTRPLGI